MMKEDLEAFLAWFAADRDLAGERYKQIHRKLVTFFRGRGVNSAEDAADETINRVATKLREGVNVLNIWAYVLAVARKVASEDWRRLKDVPLSHLGEPQVNPNDYGEEQDQLRREKCLDEALRQLEPEKYALIIRWYQYVGAKKIEDRMKLAVERRCTPAALKVQTYRIRLTLRQLVEECMTKSLGIVQ